MQVLYISSDNLLRVDEVKNVATDAYITSATVEVTLYEEDGTTEVSGETWPVSCSYLSGTNARYHGTLPDSLSLSENTRYIAKVTINGGSGLFRTLWVPARAHKAQVQ